MHAAHAINGPTYAHAITTTDAPFSARLRAEPRPVAATNFVQNGPQLSRFCPRRMANGQTRLTLS
jgi:hypothetical protein